MYELYRMLGRDREAELERLARPGHRVVGVLPRRAAIGDGRRRRFGRVVTRLSALALRESR